MISSGQRTFCVFVYFSLLILHFIRSATLYPLCHPLQCLENNFQHTIVMFMGQG